MYVYRKYEKGTFKSNRISVSVLQNDTISPIAYKLKELGLIKEKNEKWVTTTK